MLGLVPLRRKAVGGADEQLVPLDLERLCRFEPGFEGLFRQFLARTIEKTRPGFLRSECHEIAPVWKTRGAAKLSSAYAIRNAMLFT